MTYVYNSPTKIYLEDENEEEIVAWHGGNYCRARETLFPLIQTMYVRLFTAVKLGSSQTGPLTRSISWQP